MLYGDKRELPLPYRLGASSLGGFYSFSNYLFYINALATKADSIILPLIIMLLFGFLLNYLLKNDKF